MFHLKLKDTLKHSIATVTSHMDSFVYNPGRDYSRIRKLSPDHVISFLISQGFCNLFVRPLRLTKGIDYLNTIAE